MTQIIVISDSDQSFLNNLLIPMMVFISQAFCFAFQEMSMIKRVSSNPMPNLQRTKFVLLKDFDL